MKWSRGSATLYFVRRTSAPLKAICEGYGDAFTHGPCP